jgi:hypothetical protein
MEELELVVQLVHKTTNNVGSFSHWHSSPYKELYTYLYNKFIKNGYNAFTLNGQAYLVLFSGGYSGRGGMDEGSPDTITVKLLKPITNL